MTAVEALKQGDVTEALRQLQQQVKEQPEKVENRVFLFQLLAIMGQWDRALTQLNVAAELDAACLVLVAMYRQVIACELFREEVFQGKCVPEILGKPHKWVVYLLQALKLTTQGKHLESQEYRNRAFELAPAISGVIDGKDFEWLADSDSRLGPLMEVIVEGRYFWVTLDHISAMSIDQPVDLRDILWLPTHFTWINGDESYGVIPARYPGSYRSDDPQIILGRKTMWEDCGHELYLGFGQKTLTTEATDYALLDIRSIRFNSLVENAQEHSVAS
jgi:type VI secretion system protein ImpE